MAGERILLVEDNPMNRRVAEFLLKSEGYIVYEARDGPEALELVKAHLPDLILMDLLLPGLDGFAAERALEAGCDGYITKPIDADEFPETVASYLKRRGRK